MSFDSVLIHSCTINRKILTGTTDDYGQPVYSDELINSKCRFFKKDKFRQSGMLISSDLPHLVIPISVMLPASVNIIKNDTVSTTTKGYEGAYTVFDIIPIYGRAVIHHYVANLLRVEP